MITCLKWDFRATEAYRWHAECPAWAIRSANEVGTPNYLLRAHNWARHWRTTWLSFSSRHRPCTGQCCDPNRWWSSKQSQKRNCQVILHVRHIRPLADIKNVIFKVSHYTILNQVWKMCVTWNRLRSPAYCWKWSIASNTFLWPPGTRQTAPRISKTAIFTLGLLAAKLWDMILIDDGCASTWARPVYIQIK